MTSPKADTYSMISSVPGSPSSAASLSRPIAQGSAALAPATSPAVATEPGPKDDARLKPLASPRGASLQKTINSDALAFSRSDDAVLKSLLPSGSLDAAPTTLNTDLKAVQSLAPLGTSQAAPTKLSTDLRPVQSLAPLATPRAGPTTLSADLKAVQSLTPLGTSHAAPAALSTDRKPVQSLAPLGTPHAAPTTLSTDLKPVQSLAPLGTPHAAPTTLSTDLKPVQSLAPLGTSQAAPTTLSTDLKPVQSLAPLGTPHAAPATPSTRLKPLQSLAPLGTSHAAPTTLIADLRPAQSLAPLGTPHEAPTTLSADLRPVQSLAPLATPQAAPTTLSADLRPVRSSAPVDTSDVAQTADANDQATVNISQKQTSDDVALSSLLADDALARAKQWLIKHEQIQKEEDIIKSLAHKPTVEVPPSCSVDAPARRAEAAPPMLRRLCAMKVTADNIKAGSLAYFAHIGNRGRVEFMLQEAAAHTDAYFVNSQDEAGRTALHYAAYAGNIEIADLLLQHGADIQHKDRDLRTPLHMAAFKGHTEIVGLVLGTGFFRLRSLALRSFRQLKLQEEGELEGERKIALSTLQEYLRNAEDLRYNLLLAEDRNDMTCVHYALRDAFGPCLSTLELLLTSCFAEQPDAGGRLPQCLTEQRMQAMPSNTLVRLLYAYVLDHEEKALRAEHHKRCRVLQDELTNRADAHGATLLHYCAVQGNYRAVHVLVKLGADLSVKFHGQSVSELARDCATRKALAMYPRLQNVSIEADATSICQVISANCEYVNQEFGIGHRTPLHVALLASTGGEFDIDGLLNKHPEADPLLTDASGWSCIHYACALGLDAILLKLLARAKRLHGKRLPGLTKRPQTAPTLTEKGGRKQHRTSGVGGGRGGAVQRGSGSMEALMGRTPTHLAVQGDYLACLEVLRKESWFDIEAKDDAGWTPLLCGAAAGCVRAVQWLLDAGAHVYAQDNFGRTCLHLAVQKGHRSIMHQLVYWDADFGKLKASEDCKRRTPQAMRGTGWSKTESPEQLAEDLSSIWEAALLGDLDQMLCAMRCGRYAVDDVSPFGWTAVMYAAKNGHAAVLKFLVSQSKSTAINTVPSSGRRETSGTSSNKSMTPLHWACWQGHVECVELLCQYGADVNAQTTDGRVPAMFAAYAGHVRCFEALQRWSANLEAVDRQGRTVLIFLIRGAVKAQPNDQAFADILRAIHLALPADHLIWLKDYDKNGARVDPAEEMRLLNFERNVTGLVSKGKTSRMLLSICKARVARQNQPNGSIDEQSSNVTIK